MTSDRSIKREADLPQSAGRRGREGELEIGFLPVRHNHSGGTNDPVASGPQQRLNSGEILPADVLRSALWRWA